MAQAEAVCSREPSELPRDGQGIGIAGTCRYGHSRHSGLDTKSKERRSLSVHCAWRFVLTCYVSFGCQGYLVAYTLRQQHDLVFRTLRDIAYSSRNSHQAQTDSRIILKRPLSPSSQVTHADLGSRRVAGGMAAQGGPRASFKALECRRQSGSFATASMQMPDTGMLR